MYNLTSDFFENDDKYTFLKLEICVVCWEFFSLYSFFRKKSDDYLYL